MTDIPPRSLPVAEKDQDELAENAASRPSTTETYVTLKESENSERQWDNEVMSKDTGTDISEKHGIARMPELPPEIRET